MTSLQQVLTRKIGELAMDLDIAKAMIEEVDRALGRRGAERRRTAEGPASQDG